ncbi:threonine-phosphate decarboxylase [Roseobacter insulae]|uniref:threonine-phosphate decarboxylase n=1 Tax=Roseobacter insulae TaxID=2859783 RepID=UPI002151AD79|nr:threonine-phosphate decarboxylase [Roseobacter insulae]
MTNIERDHGGGLDAAILRYGGSRIGWCDLSTGINPHPYPVGTLPQDVWTALPDKAAQARLINTARQLWAVPESAGVIAASGASALIAQIPRLRPAQRVCIPGPTYNEHAAAFGTAGWSITDTAPATAQVVVHPNNPDGRLWTAPDLPLEQPGLTVIDESFCDVAPGRSLIDLTRTPGVLVLKSFGKFWGLAGLRLGFVIGDPDVLNQMTEAIGPWAVSGPAQHIGAVALADHGWARRTRERLAEDSARLDALMQIAGAKVLGGTTLFRLYDVDDAATWQDRLARHKIWTRRFPYNARWLRLGLPHALHWPRIEAALK